MRYLLALILFSITLNDSILGQNAYLKITLTTTIEKQNKLDYQQKFSNTFKRDKELKLVFNSLLKNGYLAASIDSTFNNNDTLIAIINSGKKYKWLTLKNLEENELLSSEIKTSIKNFSNTTFNTEKTVLLFEKTISIYENSGYPFASVSLSDIEFENDTNIKANLLIQKNRRVSIDSVIAEGNLKISSAFIKNYLNLKPNAIYQERTIERIDSRLNEIAFIKQSKPHELVLTENYNKLILYLDKKKASQFDGIIGALPDNNTGKIYFTGDMRINLLNSLNKAERIDINWRSLSRQTQDLKVKVNFPYVLGTPFGADYDLKLFKKDTTFIDIHQNFSAIYSFIGRNQLKVTYAIRNSNLISTKQYQNLTVLPSYADIKYKSYGLGFNYDKLDYLFNPRRGLSIAVSALAGTKEIKQNQKLNPELYKKLKLKSNQYAAEGKIAIYIPIKKTLALKIANQIASTYNESLFLNELTRMGGLKTLRGFDEESIWASFYTIQTFEIRLLFEKNSYLHVFGDFAYYENKSLNFTGDRYDTPYGFGGGISFETKAGIFSLNYALGKQFNNPIQLKSGKIHFGIVNYF
ncbi:MAG: hypothetical protein J0M08_11595 [Bacteroidetes bacterium]|nr:hypothetical protein [Bacteroidota bacterium]